MEVRRGDVLLGEWSVYKLYDVEDTLLYVGLSKSLGQRLTAHEKSKEWWSKVVEVAIERFEVYGQAKRKERHLITWLRPLYNKQHNFFRRLDPEIQPVARRG